MAVRRIRKREPCSIAGAGSITLGKAIEVLASGHVRVVLDTGEASARVPMHVDLPWLTAALARAPVDVAVAITTGAALLWCVFPGLEHASVRREMAAPEVIIRAERSLELRCGDASVTLDGRGEVRAEGKEILSRAEGEHRIQGGSVRIN